MFSQTMTEQFLVTLKETGEDLQDLDLDTKENKMVKRIGSQLSTTHADYKKNGMDYFSQMGYSSPYNYGPINYGQPPAYGQLMEILSVLNPPVTTNSL